MSPQPKNVVIMVDISSVLTMEQMMTAKELAKQTLLSLSHSDLVWNLFDNVLHDPRFCIGSLYVMKHEKTTFQYMATRLCFTLIILKNI